jgi:hypothetical protein
MLSAGERFAEHRGVVQYHGYVWVRGIRMPQKGIARLVEKAKKHWLILLIAAVGGAFIFADEAIQAARHLWEMVHPKRPSAPQQKVVEDKFVLIGVKMAFVLSYLSNEKLKVEGETIVPVFENTNDYPVTIQFERISVRVAGKEGPPVPPDDMTITFPAHNGPAGWFGSDPRIKATNGDVLNGEIDAKLKYFNDQVGLHKEMTIRGRVVAKLPKRGRVVSIEWWPDADSVRAASQIAYKFVVLGPPRVPLTTRDKAILAGQVAAD